MKSQGLSLAIRTELPEIIHSRLNQGINHLDVGRRRQDTSMQLLDK
jgi:hypothetical protein